jgi:hypothetical protein
VGSDRDYIRDWLNAKNALKRELFPLPKPYDIGRRLRCKDDLKCFIETYFATDAPSFTPLQDKICQHMELAIKEYKDFILVVPRGTGKTTLTRLSIIWALMYGRVRYAFIGVYGMERVVQFANGFLSSITDNDILIADFPDISIPLYRKRIARTIQTYKGRPTGCKITHNTLISG